ncbi:DUF1360 domain-containing protein [Rhizomonospora bruguierae]|uniref:DUF1360 domain-containing protein n=1 Tax=Rhizomonospora bruguierae TaxID=1581705 RepID=UPI001BCD6FCD|nr:DUF1360 domain-containing protein [Micromonospora sp. NBRC 107566]
MSEVIERARRAKRGYAGGEQRPLGGYLVALGAYGGVVAALAGLARLTGRTPPERVSPFDVVLLGVATHKLSRALAKDSVTSPLRAPFTRYREPAGASELNEDVRHHDPLRHAVGELISCPFCLAVWVGTGLTSGLVFAPRLTRLVAVAFSTIAASDFLQFAYDGVKHRAGE